eukprot:3941972-Rhodomonas_salina.2
MCVCVCLSVTVCVCASATWPAASPPPTSSQSLSASPPPTSSQHSRSNCRSWYPSPRSVLTLLVPLAPLSTAASTVTAQHEYYHSPVLIARNYYYQLSTAIAWYRLLSQCCQLCASTATNLVQLVLPAQYCQRVRSGSSVLPAQYQHPAQLWELVPKIQVGVSTSMQDTRRTIADVPDGLVPSG